MNILPLSGNYDSRGIQIEDHPQPDGQGQAPQARSVTPGYFAAMGVPLLRGRLFDARDGESAPQVVVISDTMARRYWPGADPVGRRITFNSGIPQEQQQVVGGPGSREVIGIVGDVRHLGLDEEPEPMFYTPHTQQPSYHTMTLVVRTAADVPGLAASVRAELRQMDGGVPLFQVRTVDQVLSRVVAQPRLRAWLLALFAALAGGLAALGVYGVVSYVVQQRTPEIGVRMALGASRTDVLTLMLGQGLRPVLVGVAVGIAGAWAVSRALGALLFGVTPGDLPSYAVAAAGLTLAALVATLVPARRAVGVDPAMALRGSDSDEDRSFALRCNRDDLETIQRGALAQRQQVGREAIGAGHAVGQLPVERVGEVGVRALAVRRRQPAALLRRLPLVVGRDHRRVGLVPRR